MARARLPPTPKELQSLHAGALLVARLQGSAALGERVCDRVPGADALPGRGAHLQLDPDEADSADGGRAGRRWHRRQPPRPWDAGAAARRGADTKVGPAAARACPAHAQRRSHPDAGTSPVPAPLLLARAGKRATSSTRAANTRRRSHRIARALCTSSTREGS
eukprot:976293-Prymnesium_polylepis.1